MENTENGNSEELLQQRRARLEAAAREMAGWAAPRFEADPSGPGEAEFRRLVAEMYKLLGKGVDKVLKEIAEEWGQAVPADQVVHEFSSEQSLSASQTLLQLSTALWAARAACGRFEKEKNHSRAELRYALEKHEGADKVVATQLNLYRQILQKMPKGPADVAEAARLLLKFSQDKLKEAADSCPDGWTDNVPEEWVTDLAGLLLEEPKAAKLVEGMLNGEISLVKVHEDEDAPKALRFLAGELLKHGKGTAVGNSLKETMACYKSLLLEAMTNPLKAHRMAHDEDLPGWLRGLSRLLTSEDDDFGAGVRGLLEQGAADPEKARELAEGENNLSEHLRSALRVLGSAESREK